MWLGLTLQRIKRKLYSHTSRINVGLQSHFVISRIKNQIASVLDENIYDYINFSDMGAYRQSDTLFIFGCGPSLKDLNQKEIEKFKQCDSLSFSNFVYNPILECRFHLLHEIGYQYNKYYSSYNFHRQKCAEWAEYLTKFKRQPIYILQGDPYGLGSRMLVGERLLPHGCSLTIYKERQNSRRLDILPDRKEWSLIHSGGTLIDCIHLGFLMGYKKIALVGVDLTSSQYFYLPDGEMESNMLWGKEIEWKLEDPHPSTARMIQVIPRWGRMLREQGTDLYIYSPKSLLSHFLPLWDWKKAKP